MEGEILEVATSNLAIQSLEQIFEYGVETFSFNAAIVFIDELISRTEDLSKNYLLYSECRYQTTKSKMYRTLIYGSYSVIYRITKNRIEILNIFHSSRSIAAIKSSRRVRL